MPEGNAYRVTFIYENSKKPRSNVVTVIMHGAEIATVGSYAPRDPHMLN